MVSFKRLSASVFIISSTLSMSGVACALAVPPDYDGEGPCKVIHMPRVDCRLPAESGCQGCDLDLFVSVPDSASQGCPQPPYPVVFFFNGFKLSASSYIDYASRLSSWGYAVIRYDVKRWLGPPVDRVELKYLDLIAENLQDTLPTGLLDFGRVGVAGHSRGGKLAALQLATNPCVAAAFLIDPVDNTVFTPDGKDYPSAIRALTGSGKVAAVAGAELSGMCNPEPVNFRKFYGSLAPGSWSMEVESAGHAQFARFSAPVAAAMDLLCGKGNTTREAVRSLTLAPMVAWMESHFRPQAVASSKVGSTREVPLQSFFEWVQARVAAGAIKFEVKAALANATAPVKEEVAVVAA